MADRKQAEEEAFERGRQVGRRDRFGPHGLPKKRPLLGAEYRFRTSYFESFVQYEREVVANLRHLQMLRWGREGEMSELQQVEAIVREELARAREAVDSELEEGRGRPAVVAALRASPQQPQSVREYWEADFAEEDPRRGSALDSGRVELGGADYGIRWGLEHPLKRWLCTRWRISWLCEEERFMFGRGDQ